MVVGDLPYLSPGCRTLIDVLCSIFVRLVLYFDLPCSTFCLLGSSLVCYGRRDLPRSALLYFVVANCFDVLFSALWCCDVFRSALLCFLCVAICLVLRSGRRSSLRSCSDLLFLCRHRGLEPRRRRLGPRQCGTFHPKPTRSPNVDAVPSMPTASLDLLDVFSCAPRP